MEHRQRLAIEQEESRVLENQSKQWETVHSLDRTLTRAIDRAEFDRALRAGLLAAGMSSHQAGSVSDVLSPSSDLDSSWTEEEGDEECAHAPGSPTEESHMLALHGTQLLGMNQATQGENNTATAHTRQLESKVRELEAQLAAANAQCDLQKLQVRRLMQGGEAREELVCTLISRLSSVEGVLISLQLEIKQSQAQAGNISSDFVSLVSELEQIKKGCYGQHTTVGRLEGMWKGSLSQLEKLRVEQLEQLEHLESQGLEMQIKAEQMQQALHKAHTANETLEHRLDQQQTQLQGELHEASDAKATLSATTRKLQSRVEVLQGEVDSWRERCAEIDTQRADELQQLEKLERGELEMQLKLESLEVDFNAVEGDIDLRAEVCGKEVARDRLAVQVAKLNQLYSQTGRNDRTAETFAKVLMRVADKRLGGRCVTSQAHGALV